MTRLRFYIPVMITNNDIDEGINFRSGVADLEGVEKIFPDEIDTGAFSNYISLKMILKLLEHRLDLSTLHRY